MTFSNIEILDETTSLYVLSTGSTIYIITFIWIPEGLYNHGVGNANELAGGISEALITTAAGLTVAIPSYFFYRYFRGVVAEYVITMEEQAIRLIEAIERGNVVQLRAERGRE